MLEQVLMNNMKHSYVYTICSPPFTVLILLIRLLSVAPDYARDLSDIRNSTVVFVSVQLLLCQIGNLRTRLLHIGGKIGSLRPF